MHASVAASCCVRPQRVSAQMSSRAGKLPSLATKLPELVTPTPLELPSEEEFEQRGFVIDCFVRDRRGVRVSRDLEPDIPQKIFRLMKGCVGVWGVGVRDAQGIPGVLFHGHGRTHARAHTQTNARSHVRAHTLHTHTHTHTHHVGRS